VALLLLALTVALLLLELASLPVAGQTPQTTVDITIDSSPEQGYGFIMVDGSVIHTPSIYSWAVGSNHTVSAAIATRMDADCGADAHQCAYNFTGWSDGGPRMRTITANVGSTLYTAYFVKNAYVTVATSPSSLSDVQVDGAPVGWTPRLYVWPVGSTHTLTALNTNGLFTDWSAPSFTSISMNAITYTVPNYGETVTANYVADTNTTTTQTTTSTVTTTSTTSANNQVAIVVTSNPTSEGIVAVDGTSIDTPTTFYWVIGSQHYLTAPLQAPGIDCDCTYQFTFWFSQSGRQHDESVFIYTVPPYPETVTAFYQLMTTMTTSSSTTATATSSTTTTQTTVVTTTVSSTTAVPEFPRASVGVLMACIAFASLAAHGRRRETR